MTRISEGLKKVVKKFLLIPIIKSQFGKIGQFYAIPQVIELEERVHSLEVFIEEQAKALKKALKNEDQLDFGEGMPEVDAKALEKLAGMVIKDKIMVVEVGSWKGMSTSVLAKTVADYHGSVFAVDHWMGSEGVKHHGLAKIVDIYSIFKRNMIMLGVWDMVHPLVMDSQTASQIIADGILDLVFIDADHRYEAVKKDISSWLPKLKDGGILCGHDCEGYYSEYPEEAKKVIDEHLGDEYIYDMRCHPGVVKALHDYFQEEYSIMPNTRIWYYIKKNTDSTC